MRPITADDPETKSADLIAENVARLRELFPEALVEGQDLAGTAVSVEDSSGTKLPAPFKIDFDVLRQLLGDAVDDREEKYGLSWHGKRRARQLALAPSTATLRPCPDDSIGWGTTQNLVIEGDNLEVLKLLQKSYAAKVKLIYIDPPYNTGKDFVYPDDFRDNVRNYLELTGQVEGVRKMTSSSEASGRFHTDWLNMIYPRLKLARQLLRDDGIMFVSIDDNEIDNLRKVCDDIFGEENRIAIICHKARASVSNDKIISSNHNFLVLYARNAQTIFENRSLFGLEPDLEGFNKRDARGAFKYVPVDGPGGGAKGNPHYTFLGVTGYWRFSQERMQRMYDEGRIEKVGGGLQQKYYLDEAKASRRTDTTWWDEKLYTSTASSRLKELMEGDPFDNPKPIELVQKMLSLWAREPTDIVLDFFAGSGTTGHAVMTSHAADEVPRRFILVQLPEPLDISDASQKAAAAYCDLIEKPRTIVELTKERLRRAARKIKDENPLFAGDLGFRVFRLDTSNIRAWEPDRERLVSTIDEYIEHLRTDRTEQDILCELLLKLGLDLCVPIEARDIAGLTVYSVGDGTLLACLATEVATTKIEPLALGIVAWHTQLAPAGESTLVFRDSAFENDVAKTNLTAILRQNGLENVRSL